MICEKLFSIHRVFLCLDLTVATRLLLPNLVLSLFKDLIHDFSQMQDPGLAARHAAQPEHLALGVLLDWCFHAVRCFFVLIGACSQLGLRFDVSLTLEMKLEDRWIREVLAARLAIVLLILLSS